MSLDEKYPPPPHPRFVRKELPLPDLEDDPMVNNLKKDLISIQKDIELNYSRLNYNDDNKVNILMEEIAEKLAEYVDRIKDLQNNS